MPPVRSIASRFWGRVNKTDSCWLWTAGKVRGYGTIAHRGRQHYAHRWSYEQAKGEIPEGYEIDHLCRVPACVNPDHLEAVTKKENILRGTSPQADNARKSHCKNGHPLSGENLVTRSDGGRRCRICKNESNRKRKAAIRAQSQ